MRIDERFNGPPGTAHGGTAAGMFARAVDPRAATVRLLQPPPLDTVLDTTTDDHIAQIVGPNGPVATVQPLRDELDTTWTPAPATESELINARRFFRDKLAPDHAFPTCFGCGPARADADGLELSTGPVPRLGAWAVAWAPDASLAPDGAVADWAIWAAMDCPSATPIADVYGGVEQAIEQGIVVVLGQLSLRIDEAPEIDETCQILARHREQIGRRHLVDVALLDHDGRRIAWGAATWVELPSSTIAH